ncbi:MAG: TRAP transporter small permease subunit [bacterium]|nr:TRAP transporter small permease subunit [bacterium]
MNSLPLSPIHRAWTHFEAALARAESVFLVSLLLLMVGVGFLQVILRNIFHTGIFSADLLMRQGLIWLVLIGASLAAREDGRHIVIDILARLLPASWAARARRLTDLFAAFICLLLARASFLFLAQEWEAGSRISGVFPAWIFQVVLPLGFALMAVRFLGGALFGRPASPQTRGDAP